MNETIIEKIQNTIPAIEKGQLDDGKINELTAEIKENIKSNPEKASELGQLIALINKKYNESKNRLVLNWVKCNSGYLSIGHKPGKKVPIKSLKQAGTSGVVTLLQENEDAVKIGREVKAKNMDWLWLPFSASNPHDVDDIEEVLNIFNQMKAHLSKGNKLYIHCSAGIHRTGMVTYAFLRYIKQDKKLAFENLEKLRQITADGATDARLEWGDQFYGLK